MNKRLLACGAGVLLACWLAACSDDAEAVGPTVPPEAPTHQIAGSSLPAAIAGYSALGSTPSPTQTSVTYASDAAPLDILVISFDPTGEFGETSLTNQQWYDGVTRCGLLWQGDANQTPRPSQAACVTVLTDGVMTTVAGGDQTPAEVAEVADAVYDQLQ